MSLINRMLQDLEQRRSSNSDTGSLVGVRAVVVQEKDSHRVWWLVALVGLLCVIAVLVWMLQQRPSEPVKPVSASVADVPAESVVTPAAPLDSLRVADVLAVPKQAEKRPADLSPDYPWGASKPSSAPVLPASSPAPEIKKSEEAKGLRKNDSAVSQTAVSGVVPVKQISPQQQAEFSYQKAVALLQQGRVSEAQESLSETIKAAPDHAASRQALVGILVEQKLYAQAEQLLRDGLSRGGNQPEFAMALARIQVERGDGHGALETLQHRLSASKDHAGYQAFLAAMYQRQGQHKLAIEHYLAALKLSPAMASSLVGLGISLQAENHPTEALEAFNRARTAGGLNAELQNFVEQRLKQLQVQSK